jgi:hypothetical protein
VFRIFLSVNSDYFPKQHEPVDICNGEVFFFILRYNLILIYYLFEISGSHGGEYDDGCLLGCCVV